MFMVHLYYILTYDLQLSINQYILFLTLANDFLDIRFTYDIAVFRQSSVKLNNTK